LNVNAPELASINFSSTNVDGGGRKINQSIDRRPSLVLKQQQQQQQQQQRLKS
jgi:hypothetical protein